CPDLAIFWIGNHFLPINWNWTDEILNKERKSPYLSRITNNLMLWITGEVPDNTLLKKILQSMNTNDRVRRISLRKNGSKKISASVQPIHAPRKSPYLSRITNNLMLWITGEENRTLNEIVVPSYIRAISPHVYQRSCRMWESLKSLTPAPIPNSLNGHTDKQAVLNSDISSFASRTSFVSVAFEFEELSVFLVPDQCGRNEITIINFCRLPAQQTEKSKEFCSRLDSCFYFHWYRREMSLLML
ncbi:hypothetical protein NQ317_005226, partial [Molorchus minor]